VSALSGIIGMLSAINQNTVRLQSEHVSAFVGIRNVTEESGLVQNAPSLIDARDGSSINRATRVFIPITASPAFPVNVHAVPANHQTNTAFEINGVILLQALIF